MGKSRCSSAFCLPCSAWSWGAAVPGAGCEGARVVVAKPVAETIDRVRPSTPPEAAVRCAIYARVSVADTQPSSFPSLAAQIEACEQYIASQRGQDWGLAYPPASPSLSAS